MPVGDAPDVFSVEEAAAVLRIGRGTAYEQARLFRETNGAEGLPVVEFGRCLRVPRAALEELLGGEIHWTPPAAPTVTEPVEGQSVPGDARLAKERSRRRSGAGGATGSLQLFSDEAG